MKKRKQLFTFLLMFSAWNVIGQIPAIDSMKIIPENPTENDEVKVIVYATFSSGDCLLENHTIDLQNGIITMNLIYTVGMATYICHSTDTLSIGTLSAGDYELQAGLYTGPGQSSDNETLLFSVGGTLGITETDDETNVTIYPNPVQNQLMVMTNETVEKIEIRSVSGQIMSVEQQFLNGQMIIDLSMLSDGIYFIVLSDSMGKNYLKKIIKSTKI